MNTDPNRIRFHSGIMRKSFPNSLGAAKDRTERARYRKGENFAEGLEDDAEELLDCFGKDFRQLIK